MANINAAEIDGIRLAEQGSNPSTPASGYGQLYAKSDGLYFMGDDGTAIGPLAKAGTLTGAYVYRSTSQSIPNNTGTAISFDTETRDDNACYDSGNPTRLVAPVTGWYIIGTHVTFATAASGKRVVDVRLNGVTYAASQYADSDNEAADINVNVVYYMTAAEYAEVTVYQNSGASLNATAAKAWIVPAGMAQG